MTQIQKFSDGEVELIRTQIAPQATDQELELFMAQCARTGLDPFSKQIYAIHRKSGGVPKMTIQVSIDGFRLVAQRSGQYGGQVGPWWADANGSWFDVWLQQGPPSAARVGVYRKGWVEPLYRVATWAEFAGNSHFWRSMPSQMLAKVAESQALRAAFPQELSGLYTSEEMDQSVVMDVKPELQIQELVDVATDMGAVVVEDDPVPTHEAIQAMAEMLFDDLGEMWAKLNTYYEHSDWNEYTAEEKNGIATLLSERVGQLIKPNQLKALHATGNGAYPGDGKWDEMRPQLVEAATEGRTVSSTKLYQREFSEIMELLKNMGDDDGSNPFDG